MENFFLLRNLGSKNCIKDCYGKDKNINFNLYDTVKEEQLKSLVFVFSNPSLPSKAGKILCGSIMRRSLLSSFPPCPSELCDVSLEVTGCLLCLQVPRQGKQLWGTVVFQLSDDLVCSFQFPSGPRCLACHTLPPQL